MYINECLAEARRYLPSEYDTGEMYRWCDEVSAMLLSEDRLVYRDEYLPICSDGRVLLPEGTDIGDIAAAYIDGGICGSRRLEKKDLRTVNDGFSAAGGTARIVYAARHKPIRDIKLRGEISVNADAGEITLPRCRLLAGDTVKIIVYSASGTETETLRSVPILEKKKSPAADKSVFGVPKDSLGTLEGEYGDAEVIRYVTEMTVCGAPYDNMYVSYILAKICLYQRDTDAYNRYISEFNTMLEAYRVWLVKHMPSETGTLNNWWGRSA